jgi:RNA polymerase sigma factor (TIGR02999 family)
MGEITRLLDAVRDGDKAALGRVFDTLYPELQHLARARIDAGERSLTPTVLVHEAYLRLVGSASLSLNDRRHFMACAARVMRAVLIDHARRRTAHKRGAGEQAVSIDDAEIRIAGVDAEMLALDEALQQLDAVNPRQREVVELRFFAGLGFEQIAELLECGTRTAQRDWDRARAFLAAQLQA